MKFMLSFDLFPVDDIYKISNLALSIIRLLHM